jgi:hypothetical protein
MSDDINGLRVELTSKPIEPYIDDKEAVKFDIRIVDWFRKKAFSGDRMGVLGGGRTKNVRGVEDFVINGQTFQWCDYHRCYENIISHSLKIHNEKDVIPIIELTTLEWEVNEWNKITIKRPESAFGIYDI